MTTNMGKLDRGVRLIAAVVLLLAAFTMNFAAAGALHWLLVAVAAIFVITALVGVCPLYSVFGIRTCRTRS